MMKKVEVENLNEVVEYAFKMNNQEKTACKSCPKEKQLIETHFKKILKQDDDFILVDYDDEDVVKGVFACLVDVESKYLECLGGFFHDETVLDDFIVYFKTHYSGWHLDFVYPKENQLVLDYLKKNEGKFDPLQIEMVITKDQVVYKENNLNIIRYHDRYFTEYKKIHTEDCYWIAERVIEAKNKFDVFLAINHEEVVGYIDISKNNEVSTIYHVFVLENHRGKGYGRALMQQAIGNKNKVILQVDAKNLVAHRLYSHLGFIEVGNSITVGLDL